MNLSTCKLYTAWLSALAAGVIYTGLMCASAGAYLVTSTEVVAVSGQAAPDSNGEFANYPVGFPGVSAFENPALGDDGFAAFRAYLTNTSGGGLDDTGVFVGNGTSLIQVSRAGDSAAGDGIFNNYNPVKVNDAGVATFVGFLGGTSGGNGNNVGVYFGNGSSMTEVVREGDAAPDADGTFSDNFNTSPGINESSQIAFRAQLNGTSSGSANDTGIFLYSGSSLTQVVREGQAAPDADGTFGNLTSPPAINNAGQLVFYANMNGTANTQGIFLATGSTITQIARNGQAAPDANGSFSSMSNAAALNNAGHVAFTPQISGSTISGDKGVFLHDGSMLHQLIRVDDAAPDANGTFSGFGAAALNNADQVAIYGLLDGTSGSDDDRGIFRADTGSVTRIVRAGQAAPGGNGVFYEFLSPAINDAGQVAVLATLSGTSGSTSDDTGIYLYDDSLGLIEVIRKGAALLGSTIVNLGFNSSVTFDDDERSGLNSLGQVAYQFQLADGRDGIALWEYVLPQPGDANGDGMVNLADLQILGDNWQSTTATWATADFTGDGVVNLADLQILGDNWGFGVGSDVAFDEALAGVVIPEPACLALLIASAAFIARRRLSCY